MIKTEAAFFFLSCINLLTFSLIFHYFEVIDKSHFHLKWYQSKWTRGSQRLSFPTLFKLKSGREELHSTWNQAGKSYILFNDIRFA